MDLEESNEGGQEWSEKQVPLGKVEGTRRSISLNTWRSAM